MLITQARSCLNQLKRMQTENLKTFFGKSDEGNQEQRKADLEIRFKQLL